MGFRRGGGGLALAVQITLIGYLAFSRRLAVGPDAAPTVSVSGGIQANGRIRPLVFTWNTSITVQGSGWGAGETITIVLTGPLNSLGVSPGDLPLGTVSGGAQGTFSASLTIPYDQGVTGPQAQIPRPGLYSVRASGSGSGTVSAVSRIHICPATYIGVAGAIDWSHERGSRDGVLPGPLHAYSPERSDPEWISVWDNRPVGAYGTILATDEGGADQPSRVSHEDDPITHYAHDSNYFLVPDAQYRWMIGTANYYSDEAGESPSEQGRIELEWEVQNNGNPKTYGSGRIGMPIWAMPTADDRIYIVGRWVLDAGHPEIGDRTEIHPPRLIAVMRRRPAVSAGVAASQVDIYVSGHGGGANQYPSGMDALLSQSGRGGGRLRDVLSANDQQTYYRAGPLQIVQLPIVALLVEQLTGAALSAPIYPTAGPSAFPWGTPAPEEQPINDMDYDFDVPLSPPPAAAASVNLEVVTQPGHSTAVNEAVTYTNGTNGLPAIAHIHLPYRAADNGIYARTLKFTWSIGAAPRNHFRVTLNHVTVLGLPGQWQMWSDIGGQWTYLTGAAPAFLQTTQGQTIATPGAAFDVYLRDSDTLRVLVQGYRANCVDTLFGTLFGKSSYSAGIQLLQNCGPVNNDDLGGAWLELPPLLSSQGTYTVKADAAGQTGGGAFQAEVMVELVNSPQVSSECQNRGSLTPVVSAGGVVGAGLSQPSVIHVSPNGLITLFGQNFAPGATSRAVTTADLENGQLPVNLACTCVTVDHRLAPMLYVSPTGINVQAPSLSPDADLSLQVVANCGAPNEKMSAPQTVPAQETAPEFFFFKQNAGGTNPVAATDAVSGALIGSSGLLPGATFTPARPGEYVALYATGLGLTDPALAAGAIANQAASTVFPASVSLNGAPLPDSDVLYAGVAPGFAGLYQVNIRIPDDASNGDLPLSLSIGGVSTPAGAYLTVHN